MIFKLDAVVKAWTCEHSGNSHRLTSAPIKVTKAHVCEICGHDESTESYMSEEELV